MMPEAFRELQERDANHFTKYAAIPFHMLRFIDWREPYIVEHMSNMFKVTPELCEERLTQIRNRILVKQSSNGAKLAHPKVKHHKLYQKFSRNLLKITV
ncbi:hypothetical protein PspKH34_23100 [Parageobacillus sp. KH3-4]|nr:hypothetical protein PspKH34_23100 [Parageobacillus sp. KH3-4]